MLGEKEAICKCPPAAVGGTDVMAAQTLTLAPATTSAVTPLVPANIVAAQGDPWGGIGNGYWFTFTCAADYHIRFFGTATVGTPDPGNAVVTDYLIPAGQEREFWVDARQQNFRAFSTAGGALSAAVACRDP